MIPPFDPYVVQHANCRASVLVTTAHFATDDWEDLRQEILLDYLHRAPRFDSVRGDWAGFVRGVMRNHAMVLFKRWRRHARWEIQVSDFGHDSEQTDLETNILDDLPSDNDMKSLLLSIDVRRLLEQLQPQLKVLADLMVELPVGEIPIRIGKSRSRVYQMIRELRTAFVEAGLHPIAIPDARLSRPSQEGGATRGRGKR
jgi:DNA-directed RNA polymerase specialized sigma24 family protein